MWQLCWHCEGCKRDSSFPAFGEHPVCHGRLQVQRDAVRKIKSPAVQQDFLFDRRWNYTPERLELISMTTLPTIGPRTIKAAITTMATKTSIRAYSTSPWPFSMGENNMVKFLLSFRFPRKGLLELFIFYID